MFLILRKKQKYPDKDSGYTLIELLVVVAIIGILAGIFLTNLTTARLRAKDVAFKTTASSIASAAAICCNSGGSPSLNAIIIPPQNPGNINICVPDINSRYPDATQIESVSFNPDPGGNCSNSQFSITIYPGTLNSGNCDHADCTEEGCIYDGC